MKKIYICMVIFLAAASLWAQSSGSVIYVAVKSVEVKESSGFFARVIETLALGDTVTLLQNRGRWLVITAASGRQGWAPADAFSSRRIVNSGQTLSTTEFALAGKGFNDDLEKIVAASGELDFSGVDAMEKYTVNREDFRAFLNDGRLSSGE